MLPLLGQPVACEVADMAPHLPSMVMIGRNVAKLARLASFRALTDRQNAGGAFEATALPSASLPHGATRQLLQHWAARLWGCVPRGVERLTLRACQESAAHGNCV